MASFGVFDSFFIIKTSQEWGRTWYSPWQSKIEAKVHEKFKLLRASKPFPNQSSMQGRELEKESNIHEFRNPLRNICKFANCRRRNFASLAKLMNFASLTKLMNFESLAKLMNFATPCETNEFRNPLRKFFNLAKFSQPCKIFL